MAILRAHPTYIPKRTRSSVSRWKLSRLARTYNEAWLTKNTSRNDSPRHLLVCVKGLVSWECSRTRIGCLVLHFPPCQCIWALDSHLYFCLLHVFPLETSSFSALGAMVHGIRRLLGSGGTVFGNLASMGELATGGRPPPYRQSRISHVPVNLGRGRDFICRLVKKKK